MCINEFKGPASQTPAYAYAPNYKLAIASTIRCRSQESSLKDLVPLRQARILEFFHNV